VGLILAVILLGGALAALWLTPPMTPILGLGHPVFAAAAVGVALLSTLLFGGGLLSFVRALVSAALWAALFAALWVGYENRDRLGDFATTALDSLSDAEPSVGASGEVTIRRALSGEFLVPAKVNDRPVKFVFDTGATTVVLTAEDAHRVGLDAGRLDFSAEVMTANGEALAAPTRIARLAIGPIVVRNVRALVTRPGAMSESLLGMSFLEELESYKVERGKLTFTARKGPG
jgi:aspartyl protease family protein